MTIEETLAAWATDLRYEDVPPERVDQMKLLVRTILGTTVAGATSEGCREVIEQTRQWGGAEEATILLHGGKVPLHSAALANSTMARALDICDGSDPGVHIGASLVPVALAAAEAVGGCTGQELIAALVAGAEITTRLALVGVYDGFDPSGVAPVFGAAVVAGRLLGLDRHQMLDAMALAFNRAGGSFQCNIDGVLAVRVIQGFASQNGVACAQLAQRGVTGPPSYITGSLGYYHLYCKDQRDDELVAGELGERWSTSVMGFKAYPSCGATMAATDAILKLRAEHALAAEDVASVDVRASRPVHRLVGHPFAVGPNPTVSGQFNIGYCVANVLLRGGSRLADFTPEAVTDPVVGELARRVTVTMDPDIEGGRRELGSRVVMTVHRHDGSDHDITVDYAPGFPPRHLTSDEHLARFADNVGFGGLPLSDDAIDALVATCADLDRVPDVRALVELMHSEATAPLAAG